MNPLALRNLLSPLSLRPPTLNDLHGMAAAAVDRVLERYLDTLDEYQTAHAALESHLKNVRPHPDSVVDG